MSQYHHTRSLQILARAQTSPTKQSEKCSMLLNCITLNPLNKHSKPWWPPNNPHPELQQIPSWVSVAKETSSKHWNREVHLPTEVPVQVVWALVEDQVSIRGNCNNPSTDAHLQNTMLISQNLHYLTILTQMKVGSLTTPNVQSGMPITQHHGQTNVTNIPLPQEQHQQAHLNVGDVIRKDAGEYEWGDVSTNEGRHERGWMWTRVGEQEWANGCGQTRAGEQWMWMRADKCEWRQGSNGEHRNTQQLPHPLFLLSKCIYLINSDIK